MATLNILDKDGNILNTPNVTEPSDTHFMGAWTLSGTNVTEDLETAKIIFKDRIRQFRKTLLEAEDVVYMKAIEAEDSSAQTASVKKKKALRDAPAAKAITDAGTIAKLKAAWDTSILGDSPFV